MDRSDKGKSHLDGLMGYFVSYFSQPTFKEDEFVPWTKFSK